MGITVWGLLDGEDDSRFKGRERERGVLLGKITMLMRITVTAAINQCYVVGILAVQ